MNDPFCKSQSQLGRLPLRVHKLTLGWTMSNPSMRQSSAVSVENHYQNPHRPAAEIVELNEISHIEFSRHLNDSSSSSRSTSPSSNTFPRPPQMPMSSSPILNNNNYSEHTKLPPKLPPRKKMATVPTMPRYEITLSYFALPFTNL